MTPENSPPPVAPAQHVMVRPPEHVAKFVNAWNRKRTDGHKLSAVAIVRPSGLTNHHLRMQAPNSKRYSLSLGATDASTLEAATSALLDMAKPRPARRA